MKNRNTESHSLDHIWVRANVCEKSEDNLTIDDTIKFLKKAEIIAKKKGFEDIKVEHIYYEGDENNLPYSTMVVTGWRLETEEEWHRRLEERQRSIKRNLDSAGQMVARKISIGQTIATIDEALAKSSLKCEVCGKPCSYTTYYNNKTKRICGKCDAKRDK